MKAFLSRIPRSLLKSLRNIEGAGDRTIKPQEGSDEVALRLAR